MTRYVLCRHAIGQPGQVEITAADYLQLASDIDALSELADVEEKFNAFIDNYFELERGLLEETLRAMIYADQRATNSLAARNTINRRIMNLLAAVKLYLDSYPQHANRLLSGAALETLKQAPSGAYNRSLGYRTMEALRNYGQHEAFPIHNWSVHFRWDESAKPSVNRASVSPCLDLSTLANAKKFKITVLHELQENGVAPELKPLIREYIEEIGIVHEEFREATKTLVDAAMSRVEDAKAKFLAEFPGSPVSVVALPVDEQGHSVGDPVYLSAVVIEYLPHLKSRVRSLVKYARRRVDY